MDKTRKERKAQVLLNAKGHYDFHTATDLMLTGKKMRSASWPNSRDFAYMRLLNNDGTDYEGGPDPEKNRLMLHRENEEKDGTFWISEVDLLADDWEVLG